jgi:hypothetical protein
MVDYAINLVPNEEMHEHIRLLVRNQPSGLQTINHTNCAAVRFQPIAISIGTGTRNAPEEEARVELGMWVAAHFNRIRMLSHKHLVPLTLPLLYVSSAQWFLFVACDRGQRIVCFLNPYLLLARLSRFSRNCLESFLSEIRPL